MKKLLLILFFLPMIGFGQGWSTTFGGGCSDQGISIQQTLDGGYIIGGEYCIVPHKFGLLLKTDQDGNTEWHHILGGSGKNIIYSVQQTNDFGYIVTGYTKSYGISRNVWLMKFSNIGDSLWHKTFDYNFYDLGREVQQTTDGGYIIAGAQSDSLYSVNSGLLIKTDLNGNIEWDQTLINTNGIGPLTSVKQTSTGDYICFGGGLIKIDQIGNEIWREDNVSGNSVVESIDGGYITAGSMIYSLSPPEYHIRLNKFDQQGNSLWYNIILGDSNLMNTPIQISNTDDGGYIIVGYRGSNSMDLWLIKIDADGNKLWDRTYGGGALDLGQSVQQTNDGGYIITGKTHSFGLNGDVWIIKTDQQGDITTTFNIPTPNSNKELLKVTDLLGRETNQTNQPLFYIYDDGTIEKKIIFE